MFTPIGFFAPSGAQVVTDSLEQWIDPAISSTADQSGNGRNVTLQGGLTTSGGNYILNGGSKYIDAGWQQTLTTTWTWACWFKINASGMITLPTSIISNYQTSTTPFFFFGIEGTNYANPAGVFFNGRTTTNNEMPKRFVETGDIQGDGWHYWAAAYNGVTGDYYGWKDGVNVLTGNDATETGNYTSAQNLIFFGGHSSRYFSNAEGGPVQLYSKKLTDDEVLQNYNADKGRYGL